MNLQSEQAMPLDSHLASDAACWGVPQAPIERRILFCGYTF